MCGLQQICVCDRLRMCLVGSLVCMVVYCGLQCRSTEWVSVWLRQTVRYTRAEYIVYCCGPVQVY